MKIELTIAKDYVPSWGLWEGVREVLQNANDAEIEHGATMVVEHADDKLVVKNFGCTIPHEAFLLGHTSKASRTDVAGHWGEGMKLGMLALVRDRFKVVVRNGREVWMPSIQRSEKFKADVLTIDVRKTTHKDRVAVEISPISAETWAELRPRFLFIPGNLTPDDYVTTSRGRLLTNPAYRGKLYVKGIYVEERSDLMWGYDFTNATLDRDRCMIDTFDAQWQMANVLREAVEARPQLVNSFYQALAKHDGDAKGMTNYQAGQLAPATKQSIVDAFQAEHGADKIPAKTLDDTKQLAHLGRQGSLVSEALYNVLTTVLPTPDKVKQELKDAVTKRYGWGDLTEAERNVLDAGDRDVLSALSAVLKRPVAELPVEVVDFVAQGTYGLYKDQRIWIARSELRDVASYVATLIHEAAHHFSRGGDGEKVHVSLLEEIWTEIYRAKVSR